MKKSICTLAAFMLVSGLGGLFAAPALPEIKQAVPVPAGAPAAYGKTGGFADFTTFTTGGAAATAANTFTVKTKQEFMKALGLKSAVAKIIYVDGMIDLCVDASGKSLGALDFLKQAGHTEWKTYEEYQEAYIAGCTGATISTLENVRGQAASAQKAVVKVYIGSNTSIIGIGAKSGFQGGDLIIENVSNVVIRNLNFLDAYDYFPSWDPSDGNINSEYDNLNIATSNHVWVDHCYFSDSPRIDDPTHAYQIPGQGNMKKWVTHDGLLDVTKGSQFVTISWNVFEDHDKSLLFGSSDSAIEDKGKLQVTLHHNIFRRLGQRMPRVRFGQVHLYNNFYDEPKGYCMGVGDNSRIWSEANNFPRPIISYTGYDDKANEGYIWDVGSVNINPAKLDTAALVGWNPAEQYDYKADPAEKVPELTLSGAGAGKF